MGDNPGLEAKIAREEAVVKRVENWFEEMGFDTENQDQRTVLPDPSSVKFNAEQWTYAVLTYGSGGVVSARFKYEGRGYVAREDL